MSVEVVACCEQLSCSSCRNTPCKCGHTRNSQADILLKRFLGRYLPVSPACSQSLKPHTREWKFDNTGVGREKQGVTFEPSHIHSTLPTAESEDSSGESEDDVVDDEVQVLTDGQDAFVGSGRDEMCTFRDHKIGSLRYTDLVDRKMSDPAVMMRKERISCSLRQQRRLSDGNLCVEEEWSEEGSSHVGCDSGYNDEKFRGSYSAFTSPSVSCADLVISYTSRVRRLTPHPLLIEKDACQLMGSDGGSGAHVTGHRPKRQSGKHHSVCSIGGASVGGASTGGTSTGGTSTGGTSTGGASSESPSMTSLWECDSPETVTDILSSLGFDDFDNPQLIPDRFIPSVIEHAKPSVMRLQQDSLSLSSSGLDPMDLPLGATAETFLQKPTTPPHSASPPLLMCTDPVPIPRSQNVSTGTHLDPAVSQFTRSKAILEPVPEETASDLSPSPRWFSPRVSIDHSVDLLDLQEGKLGSALLQKQRKRSLPQREGYRHSIGSQVESEPDSIYFSVTSYDEDITREREKEREELCPPPLPDDPVQQRRRRRGVYTPPPGLMSWLSSQHPISEEQQDPDELPWPFSEQARLRKSLSEIEQAQKNPFYEHTTDEASGQDCVPVTILVGSAISPCRSPQLSDDSHHSCGSGLVQWRSADSSSSIKDDPVDTRQPSTQETDGKQDPNSDTRKLDTRQRDLQDSRPSSRSKWLVRQKAEDSGPHE